MTMFKKGMSGPVVKKIQVKLGVNPTGFFGDETHNRVVGWQKDNGLKPDGEVGPKTYNSMFPMQLPPLPLPLLNLRLMVPDDIILALPEIIKTIPVQATAEVVSNFLGQCSHESAGFTVYEENLYYSAAGLMKIWPNYFTTLQKAKQYEMKPEAIANYVYGNRMGNGAESTGDGFKYRGRGLIQLTGKHNYALFDKTVAEDILINPDLVKSKYAVHSGAFFFSTNNLWKISVGISQKEIQTLTARINGGYNGLAHRIQETYKFFQLLSK